MAVGCRLCSDSPCSGSVRLYQAGSSNPTFINGEFENGEFGTSVSLSANGVHLVVGAPISEPHPSYVRVYYFSGTAWFQLGSTLTDSASDFGFLQFR